MLKHKPTQQPDSIRLPCLEAETVAADAEARDGELLPAELHSLRMIDYFQAQHLHQPMWLLLRCSHSYVPFKCLDCRRLAYLLNSGLCWTPEREAAELKQQLALFFSFFFCSSSLSVSTVRWMFLSGQVNYSVFKMQGKV